jgi:membrane protein involved in colicin uptake
MNKGLLTGIGIALGAASAALFGWAFYDSNKRRDNWIKALKEDVNLNMGKLIDYICDRFKDNKKKQISKLKTVLEEIQREKEFDDFIKKTAGELIQKKISELEADGTKTEAKTEAKEEAKTEAKEETPKAEAKAETKTEAKAETKTEAKAETPKAEAKEEAKTEAKEEAKTEAKEETPKTEAKEETKKKSTK